MRVLTVLFAQMLLACTTVIGLTQADEYQPVVGTEHPDFTLPDLATGRPVSLSDFRGKPVVLIHFASW